MTETIIQMREAGWSTTLIGEAVGMTRQGVHWHLQKYRPDLASPRLLPPPTCLYCGAPISVRGKMCRRCSEKLNRRTHCRRGHEYTEDNTMLQGPSKSSKRCRTCHRARMQRRYHARKEENCGT